MMIRKWLGLGSQRDAKVVVKGLAMMMTTMKESAAPILSSNVGVGVREMSSCSSRKRAVNVRKINPKVPFPEAASISHSLYQLLKLHGPLSVCSTWSLAQEANISGLNSKTHMKIMLKWMRGRKMLELICNHVGSTKKFLHCTLPREPQTTPTNLPTLHTQKPSLIKRK